MSSSPRSLGAFGRLLLLDLVLLDSAHLLLLLALDLGVDLPQTVLPFGRRGEGERRLDEVQREDAHVAVEAVLGHLQRAPPGAAHQLLLLQDEDVVGLLAGLQRAVSQNRTCIYTRVSNLHKVAGGR